MNYNFADLTEKKYPVSKLGTKPALMSKTLDKTDLYPALMDMYSYARELNRYMSKYDRTATGMLLYKAVIDAHTHFALSYYHITMDNIKLDEAYKLLECLETIKFLTEECFKLNMINLDTKHVVGLRNKVYITIATIQEQSEKWYQWIYRLLCKIRFLNSIKDKESYLIKFQQSINSYLGLLKHRTDKKLIGRIITIYLSEEWWQYFKFNKKRNCIVRKKQNE